MPAKKSSAKKPSMLPVIIIVIVVIALLGIGAFFFLNKNKATSGMMGNATSGFTSIKDALSHSLTLQCEFTEQGKKTSVSIKNGAVRADFTGATPEESGSMINKDKKMYLWTGKTGYVYDVSDDATANKDTAGNPQASQSEDLMKSIEQYKDNCKPGVVSDSLFTPPADVTFSDIAQMMKGNQGGKMMQQYTPPASNQDNPYAPSDN